MSTTGHTPTPADERRAELERERRECLEADPPLTGHHSYLTEQLRDLEANR